MASALRTHDMENREYDETSSSYMFCYHSGNGQEFLGLRNSTKGHCQVVYDHRLGKRIIIDIGDTNTPVSSLREALLEGVQSRNVWTGLLNALNRRNIQFDYTV